MKTTIVILIALLGLATKAEAQPPDFGQRNRIRYLTHELVETIHYACRTVEERAYRYGRRSSRSLDALQRLDRKARRFNRALRHHGRTSRKAERAYWKLVDEYRDTRRVLRHSHVGWSVAHDMRRIGRLLDRIAYAYQDGYTYGKRGHYRDYYHYRGDIDDDDGYYGNKRGDDDDDGYYGRKNRKDDNRRGPRGSTPQY